MSLTEDQLKDRYRGLMGGDGAAIEGVSKWNSPYSVWAVKTGRNSDFIEPSVLMQMGHALEPLCVELYEKEFNYKCRKINRTVWHKKYKFIGGHPDRIIIGHRNRGLECKIVSLFGEDAWLDGPPPYYVSQVKHYALCTGRLIWDFAAIFVSRGQVKFYTVEFTRADLSEYLAKCVEFWKLVESDTPPEVDGSKATSDALKAEWQTTNIDEIKVSPVELARYVKDRENHKASMERHADQIALIENKVRGYLQEADTLLAPDGEKLCTYKAAKNGTRRFNFFKRNEGVLNAEQL
jgi:predicted phage-related endonuclease